MNDLVAKGLEKIDEGAYGNMALDLYECFADEQFLTDGMQEYVNDMVVAFVCGDQIEGVSDTLYIFYPEK